MRKFAEENPEPLKSWINAFVDSSWQLLLKSSRDYINLTWSKQVMPYYKNHLENTYPLFKDSDNFTNIQNFNEFFGVNGIMDDFFKNYLVNFVDVGEVYWQWKNVYGHDIGFPQNDLDIFIRAALIQKMFYASNQKNPEVSFSLSPQDFSPNVQSFMLSLDEQKFIDTNENKSMHNFVWKGNKNNKIKIEFVTTNGKSVGTSLQGTWALLKLLDKTNLEASSGKQRYRIVFDLNGNAARYILTADKLVNPFIPDVINNFRCPDNL